MKVIKILFINFAILFFILIFLELILGNYFKEKKINCIYAMCGFKNTFYHNLYTKEKIYTNYTKGKFGLRNREKSPSEIDILVVGGSTSDSRYIDDKLTWPNLLEKKLSKELKKNIDVVNSGMDGQTTYGHIYNFENWYNYINEFKPKFIIFYIGINDSYLRGTKPSFFDKPSKVPLFTKKYIVNNSNFIYPLYRIGKGVLIQKKFDVGHMKNQVFKEKNYILEKKDTISKDDEYNILKFEENLSILAKATLDLGSKPIFITKKTNNWKKKKNYIIATDKSAAILGNYQERISNSIIQFSKKNNYHFIDSLDFNFEYSHYYDYNHFNSEGSEFFSETIYKIILKIINENNQ